MQKILILLASLVLTSPALSQLRSPFPSTVKGISIPNTHAVIPTKIYRGMSPLGSTYELRVFGITDILIFKTDSQGDVAQEIDELTSFDYTEGQIHHVAFPWKDFPSQQLACEQVMDALRLLKTIFTTPTKSIFFHCTVGEDRTGLLAGLFRLVLNPESSVRAIFERDMCEHGYGGGDPEKPQAVVDAIRGELTPLFLSMASLVKKGALRWDRLDKKLCRSLPVVPASGFQCEPKDI